MTMFEKAGMKLGLDKAVLSRMDSTTSADYTGAAGDSNAPSALSKSEVEELLKKGAYAALAEENDEEEKKFRAEDIDQILARRSTVIRHDETENRPADPSLFRYDVIFAIT
jgi:hypothetical protein